MCANSAVVERLECYMQDMIECFEDFVKKTLFVVTLAAGALVAMVMYLMRNMVNARNNNSDRNAIDNANVGDGKNRTTANFFDSENKTTGSLSRTPSNTSDRRGRTPSNSSVFRSKTLSKSSDRKNRTTAECKQGILLDSTSEDNPQNISPKGINTKSNKDYTPRFEGTSTEEDDQPENTSMTSVVRKRPSETSQQTSPSCLKSPKSVTSCNSPCSRAPSCEQITCRESAPSICSKFTHLSYDNCSNSYSTCKRSFSPCSGKRICAPTSKHCSNLGRATIPSMGTCNPPRCLIPSNIPCKIPSNIPKRRHKKSACPKPRNSCCSMCCNDDV